MKKRVKTWLLACPGFEAVCRALTRRHVRAIMYHRFSAHATGDPRFVDAATLDKQAAYIKRHHAAWDPDKHRRALAATSWPGGSCPVVITTDDGYADYAAIAHPVFTRHGLPAMLFVATGFVDGATWFWWDKLEHTFRAAKPQTTTLALGARTLDLDLRDDHGRRQAWHRVADCCRFLPDADKEAVVVSAAAALGVALPAQPPAAYAPITWDQARAMAAEGALFGAHTRRHPILSRIAINDADAEIAGSRARLAEHLASAVTWFAYPQGGPADWTPAVRALVADRFEGCYLAYQTLDDPADPYTMPRYCVSADMTEFRWALCGAEYLILRLRKALGREAGLGASYWADQPEPPNQPAATTARPREESL